MPLASVMTFWPLIVEVLRALLAESAAKAGAASRTKAAALKRSLEIVITSSRVAADAGIDLQETPAGAIPPEVAIASVIGINTLPPPLFPCEARIFNPAPASAPARAST